MGEAQRTHYRLYVMVAPDGAVMGFYSINAHAVSYDELPPRYARTRPVHGSIPAAFISMIGRDRRYRNQGLGSDLLVDALMRIARVSDEIGLSVVMLDVFDCGDPERVQPRKALYQRFGFMPLPARPQRLFLPIATVRRLLTEGD